ncbi:hypothetical protein IAT40_007700 [Kwoniella sp. CBS 6097]
MQVAGRLTSAWSLIREPLSHRNLLIFLILHAVTSTILFILSILSVETNADASHFLRHLIDTANLSGVVFVNPHNGKRGNWRSAPALVIESENGHWDNDEGRVCDDGGKRCKYLGAKNLDQQNEMYNGSSKATSETTEDSFVITKPRTSTMTTTMTSGSLAITTRVLVVPTLTVIQGEAITTEVMLNEQGDLMNPIPLATAKTAVATTFSSSITSVPVASASTSVQTFGNNEDGKDEEEDHDESDDDHSSDDSDDSDDEDEDEEKKEKTVFVKVDKSDFIKSWKRGIEISAVGREGRDQQMGVNVTGLARSGSVFLSQECAVHFGWSINS